MCCLPFEPSRCVRGTARADEGAFFAPLSIQGLVQRCRSCVVALRPCKFACTKDSNLLFQRKTVFHGSRGAHRHSQVAFDAICRSLHAQQAEIVTGTPQHSSNMSYTCLQHGKCIACSTSTADSRPVQLTSLLAPRPTQQFRQSAFRRAQRRQQVHTCAVLEQAPAAPAATGEQHAAHHCAPLTAGRYPATSPC